jgi:hypothetical protein
MHISSAFQAARNECGAAKVICANIENSTDKDEMRIGRVVRVALSLQ